MSGHPNHPVHPTLVRVGRGPLIALFFASWLTVVLLSALEFTGSPPAGGLDPVAGPQAVLVQPGHGLDQ
ncbi:MAG TPA: hypothetical protein VIV06_08760 [Candidatus Limnocylindrales bacterium]